MKVNLNKMPCAANFAASPPPLPSKIKPAAVKAAVAKTVTAEISANEFSKEEWRKFCRLYRSHSQGILLHWYRERQPNTSIGLRTAGDVVQLRQNGRKY